MLLVEETCGAHRFIRRNATQGMDTVETWRQMLFQSFYEMWLYVAKVLPSFLAALAVIIGGWFTGRAVGRATARALKALKVDEALRTAGVEDFLKRGGYGTSAASFIGVLVTWFVFAVFLMAAFDMLGLSQVNDFLREAVLGYLPRVIVAALILVIAAVLGDAVHRLVLGVGKTAEVGSAALLATGAKAAVWAFAILAALHQLGIAAAFVQILFTGMVVALSLALGLAFGLGGRDAAARFLAHLEEKVEKKSDKEKSAAPPAA